MHLVTAVSSHQILHKRHPVKHGIINHSFLTYKSVSVELCNKTAVERNHPLTPSDGQLVKRKIVEQHTSFVFYTLRVIVFVIFKLCKNTASLMHL